jgi:hypothetical protein
MANAGVGRPMATDIGKELTWQDVPHFLLEDYSAADTSSTILVPGYKFDNFTGNGLTTIW